MRTDSHTLSRYFYKACVNHSKNYYPFTGTIDRMPPRQYLPTHELYAEQLLPLNLGFALYEPDPGPGKEEFRIGDLGYILNGRFERIASVFKLGNGVDKTVEEEFQAINIYGDIDGRVLSSKSIRSVGVDGDASG